jgi:TLC domain
MSPFTSSSLSTTAAASAMVDAAAHAGAALSRAGQALSQAASLDSPHVADFLRPNPPTPVLWLTYHVDNVCGMLHFCTNWRQLLNVPETSPLYAKVPGLAASLPDLLTFTQFVQQQQQQQQALGEANSGAAAAAATSTMTGASIMSYLGMAYQYAFRTPSTALGDLSTGEAIAVLIGLVMVLRAVKRHWLLPLFEGWGAAISAKTHGPKWVKRNPDRIHKFAEYNFRLVYHSAISLLGTCWFVMREPWWDFSTTDPWTVQSEATLHLFRDFPNHQVSPRMAWYYLIQAAYNLDALASLLELSLRYDPVRRRVRWSSGVRGDFGEMFVHHVVTNLLIVGSSKCRLTRIGSAVFWIHDVSDVPVDLSKLAHFVRWKVSTVVCFCGMVAVWCWTRLYLLPFVVYRAVLNQSVHVCEGWDAFVSSTSNDDDTITKSGVSPLLYMVYRHAFYVLIAFLILLHTVWFMMFLQIFYSLIFKRKVEDLSEHKSGEDLDGIDGEDNDDSDVEDEGDDNNKEEDDDDKEEEEKKMD